MPSQRDIPLILLIDDDAALRRTLSAAFTAAGYQVVTALDGAEGLALAVSAQPDIVVTDLLMPHADGFALIEGLRQSSTIPIIVLSVLGTDIEKIRALDMGADDHVWKPVSTAELLARVRAQLRRSRPPKRSVLEFPDLSIDLELRRVTRGDTEVHLTPTEFALLELLALEAGRPVSIARIIAAVWKKAPDTSPDTVRVYVGTLRKKIEPDPSQPRFIVTEPWVGYRFLAEPQT